MENQEIVNKLDLSVGKTEVYNGLEINQVTGFWHIENQPNEETTNIIGKNIGHIIDKISKKDGIILTGRAPVWVYLIAFHLVVHRFKTVLYDDGGKHPVVRVAAH